MRPSPSAQLQVLRSNMLEHAADAEPDSRPGAAFALDTC